MRARTHLTGEGWYDDCTNYLPTSCRTERSVVMMNCWSYNGMIGTNHHHHYMHLHLEDVIICWYWTRTERTSNEVRLCLCCNWRYYYGLHSCMLYHLHYLSCKIDCRTKWDYVCVAVDVKILTLYYHCNPIVKTVVMVVKSFIYQFTWYC